MVRVSEGQMKRAPERGRFSPLLGSVGGWRPRLPPRLPPGQGLQKCTMCAFTAACARGGRKGCVRSLTVFGEGDQGWRWERQMKLVFQFLFFSPVGFFSLCHIRLFSH